MTAPFRHRYLGNEDCLFDVLEIDKVRRLIYKGNVTSSANAEAVEVVVALQGIITGKDLPPFKGIIKQSVTIAIVEDETVDNVLDQIWRVHSMFKRNYGDRHQDPCSFITHVDGSITYTNIDISNRLVKKRSKANLDLDKSMGPSIDPEGQLQSAAAAQGFVHTSDNEVHYFERRKDAKGDYQFVSAEPTVLQMGDIVEVQFSFAALPLAQKKTKTSLILRSVGLIDVQYSKASALSKFKNTTRTATGSRAILKRSIGYTEENLSIVQARMTLNDEEPSGGIKEPKAKRFEGEGSTDDARD
ncbi:hypothetical protein BJ165DRAFT_1401930 [Panaeolus papilionaceus]|nr:hypothetical protein BJ165DRAFT_1401930 [Panaeolus papilionaceus]